MLKFHIFLIFNCKELVRFRAICEGLFRFFSDVKNWYSIFTNVKNWYQFFTPVKDWYSIFTNVKNRYQMLTDVKNWYQIFTVAKIWYQIVTDVKNWYIIFTYVDDRICNLYSHVKDSFITDFGCIQRVSFSLCLQWELIALLYHIISAFSIRNKAYTNNLPNSASYTSVHSCFLRVSYECTSS